LWLCVTILAVMAAILIAANLLSGYDITVGSLRRDWYGSWWFLPLMGLLMVNLIVCTVIRKPWRFWQWGFLVTHSGILTLMFGAAVSFQYKIYGDMRIQEGRSASEFEIEGEREIVAVGAGGRETRIPLAVNPYVAQNPGVSRSVGDGVVLYIDRYLPNVASEPVYEPSPHGTMDVLELRVSMERMAETFFLPANDMFGLFNGMVTLVNLGDAGDVHRNLSEPCGEFGTLIVTLDGETKEIDVKEGLDQSVPVGKRTVTPRKYFGNFTVESREGPGGHANGDINPAVLFDVTRDGTTESWYAFGARPGTALMRKGPHGAQADFEARLRYSARNPALWIFTLSDGVKYVFTSKDGRKQSGVFAPGGKVKHPFMPMDAFFELVRRIERATPTLREEPPKKNQPVLPAVRIRLSRPPDQESAWIPLGGETPIEVGGEARIKVRFQPRVYTELGFHVKLLDFRNPQHEGTTRAAVFESDLEIKDGEGRVVAAGTTGVNYPFAHKGWVFYQSAFNDRIDPPMSILQISHDPGKPILYLGFVMALSGSIFMFYLKQFLVKLIKPAQTATDRPMGQLETMAWLTAGSLGTIVGSFAMMVIRDVNAIFIGMPMGIVSLALGIILAAYALRRSATRPGWALQLGQIVAAGWCINTAALVLFMIVRVPG
jgi:hypothetical protein